MADTPRNLIKQTISNTPSTSGALTLDAAATGYLGLGASDDGLTFTATIYASDSDIAAKEVRTGCTYTHSGTSLSRGTLESSTTGSALDLTSTAIVMVTASAAAGRRWEASALSHVTGTDADTTMAVNTLYVVDMSAWATADRTYTLPATATPGDRVGVMISAGDASHELLITAASGDTLNAVAGGTEWSRLFITGEVVIMRCVAANATWVVEHDGRIPWHCVINGTVTSTATWTTTYPDYGVATITQVGDCVNVSSDNVSVRRAGRHSVTASCRINASGLNVTLMINAGDGQYAQNTGGTINEYGWSQTYVATTTSSSGTVKPYFQQTDSTSEVMTYRIGMFEIL